jgi:hypothetical protein
VRTLIRLAFAISVAALVAGPAVAQPPGGRGGAGFAGRGGIGFLVANEAVQKELKIDKDQAAKVAEAVKKVQDKHADALTKLRDLEAEERRTKMRELTQTISTETMTAVTEVLNPDQVKRLKQIELQRAGADGYTRSDVQAALKLTAEQKEKVKTIVEESNKQMQELRGGPGQGRQRGQGGQGNRGGFGANQEKITALRKETADKFVAALTDDQKKEWKTLTGDEFTMPAPMRPERKKKDD